jgi:hypothetical protein
MNIRVLLAEGLKDAQKASERMHWCNNINAIKIRFLIIIVNLKGRNLCRLSRRKRMRNETDKPSSGVQLLCFPCGFSRQPYWESVTL